jgi:hypothetical protein
MKQASKFRSSSKSDLKPDTFFFLSSLSAFARAISHPAPKDTPRSPKIARQKRPGPPSPTIFPVGRTRVLCYHHSVPDFSPHLFWDTDPASIDFEAHARFVVGRVLSRGTFADWHELKRRYDLDRIRDEALQLRDLDAKALAFCSVFFNLSPLSFRCSKKAFSSPAP